MICATLFNTYTDSWRPVILLAQLAELEITHILDMHFRANAMPNIQGDNKPGGRLSLLFARPPVPADEFSQYLLYCDRGWPAIRSRTAMGHTCYSVGM